MPVPRLLQFILLIALVFAPICGMGGVASGAQAATADQSHCADMGGQQDDESQSSADLECRMGCTGVLAPSPVLSETLVAANVPRDPAIAIAHAGLSPAAEPRPPRLS